eukprot:CAMPEP_0172453990 /NCGR_PEP_ID=MMETSP1065-20121228/11108_1 /TAXON_ID=265537 /ORGANISM="Amphiprora paludosa, Strain CCMP125" /LENGTH=802 /DNA_ID=CAMNT_0013206241 /DNA_START=88 /DNA_END=2496 /DNA_ORIENTATION=-
MATTLPPLGPSSNIHKEVIGSTASTTPETAMTEPLVVSPDDSFSESFMDRIVMVEEHDGMKQSEEAPSTPLPTAMANTAPRVSSLTLPEQFVKVQQMGSHDPPLYHLLSQSEFVMNGQASLGNLETAVGQLLDLQKRSFRLGYLDATHDLMALSSDEALQQALEQGHVKIAALVEPEAPPLPSLDIELKAAWNDDLKVFISSHRLVNVKDDDKNVRDPSTWKYSKLVEITAAQFDVPVACGVTFLLSEKNGQQRRITNAEDWMDVCREWLVNNENQQINQPLSLGVELGLCTVIRISYPTHDDNDTLSRRIPIETILKDDNETIEGDSGDAHDNISYDKLLVTVAESLGTHEFVLTYTMKTTKMVATPSVKDINSKNEKETLTQQLVMETKKYFITCWNDLMDALRQFRATGELVLIPQVPDDDEDSAVAQTTQTIAAEPPVADEKTVPDAIVELTFQGRDYAKVTYPLERVLIDGGEGKERKEEIKASYWKLIGLASEAFHLGTPPRVCLFSVSSDSTKAEVKSDSYLTEIINATTKPSSSGNVQDAARISIRVEPVVFSVSSLGNGFVLQNFALSHILKTDGLSLSFKKLVRLSRMFDPVLGLTYFNVAGTRTPIGNDDDLMEAMQQYPRGDLLIRPHNQENPYKLPVREAVLCGKKCKLGSWSIPNIMFKTEVGVSIWDLSQMVPGKYRFATQYWRDLNKGEVGLSIGVITGPDSKRVSAYIADQYVRTKVLTTVTLPATGLNEWEFSKATTLGEFDVRSNVAQGVDTAFLIVSSVAEMKESPEVFISDMECTYIGPTD